MIISYSLKHSDGVFGTAVTRYDVPEQKWVSIGDTEDSFPVYLREKAIVLRATNISVEGYAVTKMWDNRYPLPKGSVIVLTQDKLW